MLKNVVKMWEEEVVIPSYEVGTPDKNPMFLEKRVYQGSSGKVYPYPVIDKICDEKVDKKYNAVYLENQYLKVMILPELGGRIQRAFDKTNNYDFVYYNEVVKPALVGLTGPWISGGIEFNWPQHHRPSTFSPVDYYLEENDDGSKTVWVNEIDPMYGTKGMAGFTLYPDKSYIEIKGQLYNRTNLPQTFLWWANPAVPANDDTMSVFPPDVHAVYDHGKRDVSTFPIATGTYYKVDYSAGVDISLFKNIPVPTSYMAYCSDYNFVGGYDNKKEAGILHIADHHVSPGKKQWTWGNGDFGQAWDRNLTDDNGPYIELMTGVFTDNQPDFTWLKPFEEKSFKQYFMPYKQVGMVKAASIDVAVGIEIDELSENVNTANTCVYSTSQFNEAVVLLTNKEGKIYHKNTVNISPNDIYKKVISIDNCKETDLTLTVYNNAGEILIQYDPQADLAIDIPEPAIPVLQPEQVESLEELYLIGLHIEQYRHATYDPDSYYLEGLKRDSTDIRLNTAYGTLLLRRGLFEESEKCFKEAIKKMQMRNPNPYDSEAMYQLGLSYFYRNKYDEAYKHFRKAAWSNEQQEHSFYYSAALESKNKKYDAALELVELSLIKNSHNIKARGLKSGLLRILGRAEEAFAYIKQSLEIDKFDFHTRFEEYLLNKATNDNAAADSSLSTLKRLMRDNVNSYLEFANDYAEAGFYGEAISLLTECSSNHPMLKYYEAYYHMLKGNESMSISYLQDAASRPSLYCFPNKLVDIAVLTFAIEKNGKDDKAYYYLGNLWYDKKQYDKAYDCYDKSAKINPNFATVHRNLSLIYFNKRNNQSQAIIEMETAYNLDPSDARVLLELDQLYKKCGVTAEDRIKLFDAHLEVVFLRDDLYTEYVTLHNLLGNYSKALELTMERQFHPWEGGEGKISSQYVISLTQMAGLILENKQSSLEDIELAVSYLERALVYPNNLGEGKLAGTQDNNIHYFLGCAYERLNEIQKAEVHFKTASFGLSEPAGMMYYNDQPADMIMYQGLAHLKLGEVETAKAKFMKLIAYGKEHMNDQIKIDFFAVSLPDFLIFDEDLDKTNKVHCYYLIGLGNYGLCNLDEAADAFDKAWELDKSNCGVAIHKTYL
jgi:tetratricopeptide (TPR) repeat protein